MNLFFTTLSAFLCVALTVGIFIGVFYGVETVKTVNGLCKSNNKHIIELRENREMIEWLKRENRMLHSRLNELNAVIKKLPKTGGKPTGEAPTGEAAETTPEEETDGEVEKAIRKRLRESMFGESEDVGM